MKSELIKLKDSKGTDLGEHEYTVPENLNEALATDGEDKVYSLYAQIRKIRWRDAKKRELTGGGLPKELIAKLKDADPEKLKEIAELLGLDLG